MIAVVQRVFCASVSVSGAVVSQIGKGLVVLLGIARSDTESDARMLAKKIGELRIMADEAGKMNRSLVDVGGELLAVSQFTLIADVWAGRRPSFIKAATPDQARWLYDLFVDNVKMLGIPVQTGRFGEYMTVELVNDEPVTLILDTSH